MGALTVFDCTAFFSSGLNSIVSTELAAVVRDSEGIGCEYFIVQINQQDVDETPQMPTYTAL